MQFQGTERARRKTRAHEGGAVAKSDYHSELQSEIGNLIVFQELEVVETLPGLSEQVAGSLVWSCFSAPSAGAPAIQMRYPLQIFKPSGGGGLA